MGYKMIRGGVIGIRFVSATRINEAKPRTKHAAMKSAENNNQFENDSFRLSYRNVYGKINARLIKNP